MTSYLEAEYVAGTRHFEGPLLVKFAHKKGAVIFTSFHNAAQNSELEKKLLEYLVFTAVTVQVEAEVRKQMKASGFEPQDTTRLGATAGQATAVQNYTHPAGRPLHFALAFSGPGATLRLLLVSPHGQKIEHEDTASFLIELENAPAGEWRYAVTAESVPFPNYPLTMTVGRRAAP